MNDEKINMLVIDDSEVQTISMRSVSYRFNPPITCLSDDRLIVDPHKGRYTHLRDGKEISSGKLEYILQGASHGRH
jgi:hypothetical protein